MPNDALRYLILWVYMSYEYSEVAGRFRVLFNTFDFEPALRAGAFGSAACCLRTGQILFEIDGEHGIQGYLIPLRVSACQVKAA